MFTSNFPPGLIGIYRRKDLKWYVQSVMKLQDKAAGFVQPPFTRSLSANHMGKMGSIWGSQKRHGAVAVPFSQSVTNVTIESWGNRSQIIWES